jgi:hypothetical protein
MSTSKDTQKAVLRIHDILVWIQIRIRGSMPLTNGSGSGSCYFHSFTFKTPIKLFVFYSFSAYYFLKVLLHHFSKIKVKKKTQNRRNQGFSYYFCLMIEGSPGSGSKTCGSGGFGSGSATLPESMA